MRGDNMNHMKVLRKQAGFKTVHPAAQILNVSAITLYAIEQGIRRPSIEVAARMREIYNCTLDDIFLPYITTNCNN